VRLFVRPPPPCGAVRRAKWPRIVHLDVSNRWMHTSWFSLSLSPSLSWHASSGASYRCPQRCSVRGHLASPRIFGALLERLQVRGRRCAMPTSASTAMPAADWKSRWINRDHVRAVKESGRIYSGDWGLRRETQREDAKLFVGSDGPQLREKDVIKRGSARSIGST